jgi:hypothetical protein
MWLVMLESAKDRVLGVDPPPPQNNLSHYMFRTEQLAY